jgi:hypothetical protein
MSDNLTAKLDKCFFVGYPKETKGYYFYNKAEKLVMVSSWRKSFSLKELVGARCNLKKFKKYPKMFQYPLIPYRRYKMLYHYMLKHQPHIGL